MKRFISFSLVFAVLILIISSCLTVEKKEYKFEFTGKNAGKLTIKYVNLMSMPDYTEEEEQTDNSKADFDDLISTYIQGDKIENDFPLATNVQKRLFEENGLLCGEVTMDFPNLEAVRLYQFDKKSPIMFSVSGAIDGESFVSTNGVLGNSDYMNVVFWKAGSKLLTVATSVTTPDEETVSLLKHYKKWKN